MVSVIQIRCGAVCKGGDLAESIFSFLSLQSAKTLRSSYSLSGILWIRRLISSTAGQETLSVRQHDSSHKRQRRKLWEDDAESHGQHSDSVSISIRVAVAETTHFESRHFDAAFVDEHSANPRGSCVYNGQRTSVSSMYFCIRKL